jgi:uncharacterized protein
MGRLLVIILVVVLAVWLIRRALSGPSKDATPKPSGEMGDLVSCARCGVHLPRAEARAAGGRLYCGEEHARLGAGG